MGVYPEQNGQDESVGQAIAGRVGGTAIHLLVHDDDVLAYWLWRDGELVDSFHSRPGYFGEQNRAAEEAMAGRPEALADVAGASVERLREFFRPELLNRIDDVLVFRPLSKDHLRRVVELELGHVEKLLQTRALGLRVSDAAKAHLVDLGYEPALGARPLKRVILRHVQDPLAEGLLSGRFAGCSAVRIELEGDALKLDGEPSAPAGSS